jgi:hypothetical protein
MRKIILSLAAVLCITYSFAQTKKTSFYGGIVVSKSAYLSNAETNKALGIGLEGQLEHRLSKRFSLTVSAGYNHFTGDYTYPNYWGPLKDTTIHHYSNIPVLGGIKFYCLNQLYLGAEVGVVIGADKNTGTHSALTPSIGYKISTGKNNSIDLGLRLINVNPGFGIPEANSLTKGGYGLWSFKVAYGF